jgi:hypothetical protein
MNKQFERHLEHFLVNILGGDKMNNLQLALLHTAGSIYEIASGQSFTQRVLIPKAIKLYKEKSYLYKGINRYVQWREHAFLG